MLASFRVENLGCLRDVQTLGLAARADRTLEDTNILETGNQKIPRLLASIVLYGSNGWGKTTLLKGLRLMADLVTGDGGLPDIEPFVLDRTCARMPITFEMDFLTGATRYNYLLSLQPGLPRTGTGLHAAAHPASRPSPRIVREKLVAYTSRRPTLLFEHVVGQAASDQEDGAAGEAAPGMDEERWIFGPRLKGFSERHLDEMDHDAPFLRHYLYGLDRLEDVREWFEGVVFVDEESLAYDRPELLHDLNENPVLAGQIAGILSSLQMGVDAIVPGAAAPACTDADPGHCAPSLYDTDWLEPDFLLSGTALPFDRLSRGTRLTILFLVAAFRVLDNGGLLVCDGLDGLHPLVLRRLVDLFHAQNRGTEDLSEQPGQADEAPKSQLVLATHVTSLLQSVGSHLRRDQIWFVERTSEGSSELFSLASFSPRKADAVERRYLSGLYGALPGDDEAEPK